MFGIKNTPRCQAAVCGLVLSVGLSACGEAPSHPFTGDPPPINGEPATFRPFGNNQTGVVGQALVRPIGVVVSDENGDGVGGEAIRFEVVDGGGYVTPGNVVTDDNGLARARWVLGTSSGGHGVTATLGDSELEPLRFSATAVATTAVRINLLSGDAQTGRAGERLSGLVTVQVQDQYGNGVEHQIVKFSTDVGHGYFIPEDLTADESGMGNSMWFLGDSPGSQEASIWSPSLIGSPIRLTATAN